eukprot:TRINITY_DN39643_c0_g1_i2.p1 TRINITY_DN39643_c0_g1~~TRINITY_DN39643_c0_g1_i2.p1  ORF type:complete len:430 (+),score=237.95 TRINITY_DN39643_c0_g1_i2:40-1290(+)
MADWLQIQRTTFPDKAAVFEKLAASFNKKLWYQLSVDVLQAVQDDHAFFSGRVLVGLWSDFVLKCQDKLKRLDVVRLLIAATRAHDDNAAAIAFLTQHRDSVFADDTVEKAEEAKSSSRNVKAIKTANTAMEDAQARIMCDLELATLKLKGGDSSGAGDQLDECKVAMDEFPGVLHTAIHSSFYRTNMEFQRAHGTANGFFENALMFLAYTPKEELGFEGDEKEQVRLASDIGLAALTGDNVYNFGELLQHPIVEVLRDTEYEWLADMMATFHHGDIDTFHKIFKQHASQQAVLSKNEAFLERKIRIMSLMEIAFQRPSDERTVPFADIAKLCQLDEDQIEMLVMKSFSLGVLRGEIDQVARSVKITWVQPRVLNMSQIKQMKERLAEWSEGVDQTARYLQNSAPELLRANQSFLA